MIQHVALETKPSELDEAIAFWALLGFERVEPPETLVDVAAWVQRAGTQVHLLFTEDPVVMPQGHVAVIAENYAAALERLSAAGFRPQARREHWGSPRCFVTAPGGHRVEVMAFPPPA
jgi:catechol 2,3-dioxygenase-like lactoylglutathione lyase family enzyme